MKWMRNKRISKMTLAVILVCCMVLGLVPPKVDAQTYGEWLEQTPVNGSFEAGYEGMDVYGWSLTSMKANTTIETTDNWAANYTQP